MFNFKKGICFLCETNRLACFGLIWAQNNETNTEYFLIIFHSQIMCSSLHIGAFLTTFGWASNKAASLNVIFYFGIPPGMLLFSYSISFNLMVHDSVFMLHNNLFHTFYLLPPKVHSSHLVSHSPSERKWNRLERCIHPLLQSLTSLTL